MKISKRVLIAVYFCLGQIKSQEITFTDTHRNKRFTGEVIKVFSDSKVNPISCLTHCLAAKKTCKSINVNEKMGKCELLGESKLMDDHLEMKSDEGWIYYGPGETPEKYNGCKKSKMGPQFCYPKERNGKHFKDSVWERQNERVVCFENKDNRYGKFHLQRKGRVVAFKLDYVSGYLNLGLLPGQTYWGAYPYKEEQFIGIIICDDRYDIIVPNIKLKASKRYYTVPNYLHNSKELVLEIPESPYDGDKGKELQIWHSEDFFDNGFDLREKDNSGKICVNVYAKFV